MQLTLVDKNGHKVRTKINNYLTDNIKQQDHHSNLNKEVLLLNNGYRVVGIISARDAICLLCRNTADILSIEYDTYILRNFEQWVEHSKDTDNGDIIQSVNFKIIVPDIIRLSKYSYIPIRRLKLNKRNIYLRDDHRCQYCGKKFQSSRLSIDHVVPKSKGGKNSWENMVTACVACNTTKNDKTPREAGMQLIKQPKKPQANKFESYVERHPNWALFTV